MTDAFARFALVAVVMASMSHAEPRRVPHPERGGQSLAVQVGDVPLIFTEQVSPKNLGAGANDQIEDMIGELAAALAPAGLRDLVRLNVYVVDETVTAAVDAALSGRFGQAPQPVVTLVRTPLPRTGALVACDAIAVGVHPSQHVKISAGTAIMPAGGKIFVAGQAKRANGLAASVVETMAALHASVAHLGRAKSDIVHVKAFITPFGEHAVARAEIAKTFGGGNVPPIVIIEWLSNLAAEIELVVAHPELTAKPGEPLAYLPLPGMSTSPVFSRVTTVAAGTPLIFISGLDGGAEGDARAQWQNVFGQLAVGLRETGSSFRHMVKATYFLADPQARAALGEIRGVYYDPARPPSASALDVTSIGRPGRRVMLDMIAAPAKAEAAR